MPALDSKLRSQIDDVCQKARDVAVAAAARLSPLFDGLSLAQIRFNLAMSHGIWLCHSCGLWVDKGADQMRELPAYMRWTCEECFCEIMAN